MMLFAESILKIMTMKDLNSCVKGGMIHKKSFLGTKANRLSHYTT